MKPLSIRWFWRSKLFCASTSWARAAASAACAERSALSSSCGSSFASTWSGSTLSPTSPFRSMIRPPMRKARLTSFSARMSPVSDHRIADLALFDGDGADRARLGRLGLGFLIAAGQQQRQRGRDDERASESARCRMTGGWSQVAVLWRKVGQCLSRHRMRRNARGIAFPRRKDGDGEVRARLEAPSDRLCGAGRRTDCPRRTDGYGWACCCSGGCGSVG